MLKIISPGDAQRVRDFLKEAGYDEANLRRGGYLKVVLSSRLRNLPRFLDRTREPNCLNTLLRWFWLGVPQNAECARLLPEWFTEVALSVGLLRQTGDSLVAAVMLYPCRDFLAVCDHFTRLGSPDPDFVLWPNPTSELVTRFTVRRPSRVTLDMGTGNAVQALAATGHSDHVIATDLNLRAINYAKFAAALNGLHNIECLAGDGFAPVAGRKFDLIVFNPPFFIGPAQHHVFCDNPMDLDQFCRRFVKEAPAYLEEGGYFQVICEWAQVRGQAWHERVSEWVDGTGCDAWIVKAHTEDPADYAQHQLSATVDSPDQDLNSYTESYNDYMGYYRERNVEAIHGGIIAMRRRSGQNWRVIDEFSELPKDAFGESVLATFSAQDFLRARPADDQLLSKKLTLSPACRLQRLYEPTDGQWRSSSLTLQMTKGFPFCVTVAPALAELLSACDGSRAAGELIQALAQQVDAPQEKVQAECLEIIRKLLERSFVTC